MNDSKLQEELLGLEIQSPALKEKYEKEVAKMLEKALNRSGRFAWGFFTLMGFSFMVGFAGVALLAGPGLPWQGRMLFAAGSLFGALLMVLSLQILLKGTFHQRKDSFALFGLIWVILVVSMVGSLLVGGMVLDTAKGTKMVVSALAFLVLGGLPLTWSRIEESELRLREYILGLQLRIEELLEKQSR
ncbi:hypothetical protein ACFLZR_00575 [Candidatus Neomarinimicrobiota bacterium]